MPRFHSMQENPQCPPPSPPSACPTALCERLDELGIAEPFPVQAATLPDALAGRDVCGKAPTGSGKTIAFGLPLLARIEKAAPRRPRASCSSPPASSPRRWRTSSTPSAGAATPSVLAVYGGAGMQRQMQALSKGVEVVVATPGRLKDLLERGSLRLDDVEIVVVDEADRMADMGFLPEVRRLLDRTNAKRQTMLFSATLDGDVDVLIRHYQTDPVHHEAESMEEQGEVTHRFWGVSHADRIQVATAIVERSWPAIVFSRTRHGAERLSKQLNKAGVRAEAIHGDRSQSQRERALGAFGRGDVHVLVATDVAARGIHVDGVACVLQYDPPATDKDYVHRSGRTGRAGAAGHGHHAGHPREGEGRPASCSASCGAVSRSRRRRPPPPPRSWPPPRPSRSTAATASTASPAASGPAPRTGPVPSGRGPKPARGKPHRKGSSPRTVAEGDWTPRQAQARASGQGRNGQERAGAPARSGRPGAKPGRRPAGAGAARRAAPPAATHAEPAEAPARGSRRGRSTDRPPHRPPGSTLSAEGPDGVDECRPRRGPCRGGSP